MNARAGLVIQEITTLLQTLFARHKSLRHEDVLRALEFLRHTITEQKIRQQFPKLARDDPADKKRKGGNNVAPSPKDDPLV